MKHLWHTKIRDRSKEPNLYKPLNPLRFLEIDEASEKDLQKNAPTVLTKNGDPLGNAIVPLRVLLGYQNILQIQEKFNSLDFRDLMEILLLLEADKKRKFKEFIKALSRK